ncbi:MAG TPA: hypothetical protein VK424_08660 [Thermoplasmata archaeon]|nr:hypothetical protein [Thermoplasmata archaeon]
MTSYTSAELTAILIQVVIALLVIRRSYAMTQGVPYSAPRLVVLPALILVLWGVSELESVLLTPWALPYLIALDFAILVVTTFAFTGIAERMTRVDSGPAGSWSYQIGFSLAALFVGAFVIRLSVAVALFPSSLEFGSPPGGFPPIQQQAVLGIIDALFSVSVGLLVGRSLGISRKVRAARASVKGVGSHRTE